MTNPQEDAQKIADVLNNISLQNREVAKILANIHPTSQTDIMRFCMAFIRELSEKTNCIDLRNERAVKVAKKIASTIEYDEFFFARI